MVQCASPPHEAIAYRCTVSGDGIAVVGAIPVLG
jgi:hypothetical protein